MFSTCLSCHTCDAPQANHLLEFSYKSLQRCTSPRVLKSDMNALFQRSCRLTEAPIDLNAVLKDVSVPSFEIPILFETIRLYRMFTCLTSTTLIIIVVSFLNSVATLASYTSHAAYIYPF